MTGVQTCALPIWSITLGGRYSEADKKLTLLDDDPILDENEQADQDWNESTFTGIID